MSSSHSFNSSKPATPSDGDPPSLSGESYIRKTKLPSGLYVVATPIGNLRDVTLRALDTLASVDVIYAEDTRQTRRLLDTYGIKAPLRTYHDHNGAEMRPRILDDIERGHAIALVSDAGTPLISDPGFKLVRDLRAAEVKVFPVPGPSALTAALSAAGLPTDTFLFAGFLPAKSNARQTRLREFSSLEATLVIYETGNRLADTLGDVLEVYGNVELVMAREITKLFETFHPATTKDLLADITAGSAPKGEIVLMLSLTGNISQNASEEDIQAFLSTRIAELGAKRAAAEAALQFNRPKRDMYNLAISLKDG